jgi:hypothetical protein
MRQAIAQERLTGHRVGLDRHRVAHRPAGQKDRRLLAEQLRDHFLEPVGRRILPPLLVGDLCLRHRASHRGRGAGHGVGEKLDHGDGSTNDETRMTNQTRMTNDE